MRIAQKTFLFLLFIVLDCSALGAQTAAKTPAKNTEQSNSVGQSRIPVEQLQIYVDGFHNYKRDADLPAEKQMQMRVTHYCQPVNDDLIQCVVYDGNTKGAHLIGIEHIISDKVFQRCPKPRRHSGTRTTAKLTAGCWTCPGCQTIRKRDCCR